MTTSQNRVNAVYRVPHNRHTFASHLAMRGAPLNAIPELPGHATIMMTMRYAHLVPGIARDAVRLLDGPIDRGKAVAGTAAN